MATLKEDSKEPISEFIEVNGEVVTGLKEGKICPISFSNIGLNKG